DTVNYPNFSESKDDGAAVDIVELPHGKIDIVSDIGDIEENRLEYGCP
ncbi:hypothetical protein NPIL_605131, partial [Nephila pilipes]